MAEPRETPTTMDRRVAHLETSMAAVQRDVAALGEGVKAIFGKLDAIGGQISARPASWDKMLGVVVQAATLIGILSAGIIFIAQGLFLAHTRDLSDSVARADERLRVIERILDRMPPPQALAAARQ